MAPSTRPVLVLQHVPWERPGLIADALATAGLRTTTRTVLDERRPALPDLGRLAGLVVMGGPMGATDDHAHPGLPSERAMLAAAVEADLPVLGVCLGMQLLGVALGATLHPGHGTELGFGRVQVGDDPALAPLSTLPVLHWHSDAVDLPVGATLLASSSTTPVQAFRAGSALGLQFHAEVDEALLAAWLRTEMADDLRRHGVTDLPAQAARHLPALVPAAGLVFGSFARAAAART